MSRTTARHRKPDQRSSGRPSMAPQRSSSGPSVARQHRKSSPIVSVLQNKPARAAAAAVAGSALLIAAWPTASHWIAEPPHASGVGQADALGLAPAGAHRSPAHQQAAAADVYASRPPAATLGEFVSEEPEIVSVAVASRPGRHRKPSQTGQPSPSGYLNPLRAVSGLVPERVDQGVDFAGTGPVYAIGDAVVTDAMGVNSGWPGGGWVSYQLTDGPDAGLVVYVAEDVTPTVQAGQHVSSATVIANMYNGGDGIETGWAAAQTSLTAESQMPEAGGTGAGGPFPTMVGLSFDGLLQSLGVPASPGAGTSGYGTLPAGYPAA